MHRLGFDGSFASWKSCVGAFQYQANPIKPTGACSWGYSIPNAFFNLAAEELAEALKWD
jgi:hypothetical protein